MTEPSLASLNQDGFTVLRNLFEPQAVEACRQALWPTLLHHIQTQQSNRGPHRHFLPMPFTPSCFNPSFFFDPTILSIIHAVLGERIAIDQWSVDTPVLGSEHQQLHVDYARPLFPEQPTLQLPAYMLVVSFGLVPITLADGPIEIAPGTHRMPREQALEAIATGRIHLQPIPLNLGDVLIRHPWALHRGTPNTSPIPRPLATIRYVRPWYADASREVNAIPQSTWQSLTPNQQSMLRFP